MSVPQSVDVGPNEQIVFWCRRALYELVEEFSQGIFFVLVWTIFIVDLHQILPSATWGLLLNIFPLWYMAKHYLDWHAEVHVVTEYTADSNGTYYKYFGYFNQGMREIPITRSSPDVSNEMQYRMRIWRWITGEDVEKIVLSSEGNTHISSQRMPRSLRKAIKSVRGRPSPKYREGQPLPVQESQEIRSIWKDGIFSKWEVEHHLRQLWSTDD